MLQESIENKKGKIWFNGEMVEWQDAKIHVLTHSLHYASAVFEGERAFNGIIFERDAHHLRLLQSAKIVGYDIPYSLTEINQACADVMKVNDLHDCYLRPVAFRSGGNLTLYSKENKINLAIAAWEWPALFSKKPKGIRMITSSWQRPSPKTIPHDSKCSGLYMICTLSKSYADDMGYDDALMLDYRGLVSEGTGANIFFIKDAKLHTPKPDCFLDGITRQTIIKLAKKSNIEVFERYIHPLEIAEMNDAFICGTAAGVAAVQSIDNNKFQSSKITQKLAAEYDELVQKT